MFKIKFRDDEDKQIYTIYCRTDDLNLKGHPYFVSIHRLIEPNHSPIIAIDNKERKRFENTQGLLIPVQNVILIEKIEDEKPRVSEIRSTPAIAPETTESSDKKLKEKKLPTRGTD